MYPRLFLILITLTVFKIGYSQSSIDELKLYGIDSSTMKYKVDNLTKEQFISSTEGLTQEQPDYNLKTHVDSLRLLLSKVAIETDSCIIINNSKSELKICNKNGRYDHESELYKLLDYKCGYLIALNGGYEWWKYLLIDPETGKYFTLMDQPVFIDCSYAYSYGDYYMEGQFILQDLINNKKIAFDSFNWSLEKCIRKNKDLYFEFRSYSNREITRYLTIQFE